MFRALHIRVLMVLSVMFVLCVSTIPASALGSQPVIAQLKTGETGLATHELISVFNNSNQPVDVTNWCAVYSSSTDVTKTNLACFSPPNSDTRLLLAPFSYARLATADFTATVANFRPDFIFSPGIAGTAGHVRLLDSSKTEIDKIGWGNAVSPETSSLVAHKSGYVYQRKAVSGEQMLQDTNNNLTDFSEIVLTAIPQPGLYEELVDVCSNLSGPQTGVPAGYVLDPVYGCLQDFCLNIDGLQTALPDNFESLDGLNCYEKVVLESSVLDITELLPNVASTDTGKEFVEIFNPNTSPINLKGYVLELGPTFSKTYTLDDFSLDPGSYFSISDATSQLVLPNSTGNVRLRAPNGTIVSETETYIGPQDDEAWAFIDDSWQYTNHPTPGQPNVSSDIEVSGSETDDPLVSCGPGKYRNPDTNRCKSIVSDDTELKPCEIGQERNPDTNRCRSTGSVLASLASCKVGQERNPATNRCRSVSALASALVPCSEGQERNPDTNRCKKSAVLGDSTAKVQDLPSALKSSYNYWLIGGLVAGVFGYGLYEWRHEIVRGLGRLKFKN